MYKVLVVDDDLVLQQSVKKALEFHLFHVQVANNGREAVSAVYRDHYDLVVMDVNMPEMNGIDALIEMKKHNPAMIVIILTAYSNVADAVKAVKEGAYNYLEKPILTENLVALIKRALKARSLVETMVLSAPTLSLGEKNKEDKFVGESGPMKKVFGLINKLAKVNTPVLIRGESGTGKELVAKAIHYNGPRKDEKFVVINCGAIPENLIESELFGHEKGAFTGANERKIGKFQFADGGTLFLDEIGDVSPGMQVKLLRALQEKTFTPVGSNRDITVDVRVIAASNKNFEEMIKAGSFRDDLFYRLNVLPVYLPPLKDRISDISVLVEYYIVHFNKVHGLSVKGVSEEAMKIMADYNWPGNIRELKNVIEHAFIMESGDYISPSSLPEYLLLKTNNQQIKAENKESLESIFDEEEIRESVFHDSHHSHLISNQMSHQVNTGLYNFNFNIGTVASENAEIKLDFQEAKDLFEKEFIIQALKHFKGKINQTALRANIPKKTLLRKIEKYGISPKEYY